MQFSLTDTLNSSPMCNRVLSGTDDIPVVTSASLLNLTDAEIGKRRRLPCQPWLPSLLIIVQHTHHAVPVTGDESVAAEFTIETHMFRGLQAEIAAAVGPDQETVWGEATASEGMERLAAALEDGKLEALNVVGWEINERCVATLCVCVLVV